MRLPEQTLTLMGFAETSAVGCTRINSRAQLAAKKRRWKAYVTIPVTKRKTRRSGFCKSFRTNGTDRSRTDDLLRVKQALYQLSYDPV
jgi:hypothetical protein